MQSLVGPNKLTNQHSSTVASKGRERWSGRNKTIIVLARFPKITSLSDQIWSENLSQKWNSLCYFVDGIVLIVHYSSLFCIQQENAFLLVLTRQGSCGYLIISCGDCSGSTGWYLKGFFNWMFTVRRKRVTYRDAFCFPLLMQTRLFFRIKIWRTLSSTIRL